MQRTYRVAFRLIRTVQKIRNSACSMNSEGNKILKLVVRGIRMFELLERVQYLPNL